MTTLDEIRAAQARPTAREATNGHSLPRTVYIGVYATDEYGDCPSVARITIDDALVDRLTKLSQLCIDHGLNRVAVYGGPDAWGPAEESEDLRLQGDELVVDHDSFWFSTTPKHASYSIETRMIHFGELQRALEATPDGVIRMESAEGYEDDIENMEAEFSGVSAKP